MQLLQQLSARSPMELMMSTMTLNLSPAGSGGDDALLQPNHEAHCQRDKQRGVDFVGSLGALGAALSMLPLVAGVCSNPVCRNLEGVGDEAGQQGSLCAACRKARYCSKACQKQHWKLHKQVCKTMAEAAKGAAAEAVPSA